MSGPPRAAPPRAERPRGPRHAGPVLIVEDDPDIAEGLRFNFERHSIRARVALTGEEGLLAALDPEDPPALVVLDLLLPAMTGVELCRRLRREPATRDTPIIVVTACDSAKAGMAVHDSGANDYFVKPFSVRELVARVGELLGRPGV